MRENMLTMSDGTKVMTWVKDGYGVFLAEYRGYCNSEGEINQKKMFSDWALKDNYPSEKTIQKLTASILIIHGTADTLVPVHHAEILYGQKRKNTVLHLLAEKGHREAFWTDETPVLILDWLKRSIKH